MGDLSSEIGTNISSLGVDTTTDSSKKSDSRATETVARDVFEKNSDLSLNLLALGTISVKFSNN